MFSAILIAAAGLMAGIVLMFIMNGIQSARRRRRARRTAKEPRRRFEFSKILAAWAVLVATATIAASVVLAAFDKQTVSDIAIAVFTACVGYLVTYAGKSAFEKNSRNKHHLDEDGRPYDNFNQEDDTQ
ncbi:MAG: hypothetical protein LBJ21_09605 [Acidobacteriota bacterium]|nr:hypothetical protein [Acidobacteriota bacterium]